MLNERHWRSAPQLKDVEKLLKLDPGNTELLAQKQKLLADAVSETKEKLETAAREAGETTKFSATEAAEAMSYMGLAGWNADQMCEGLSGILNLAAASEMR